MDKVTRFFSEMLAKIKAHMVGDSGFLENPPSFNNPTKIYLDIDGTLIHEDLTENYGKPAAGLEDFIKAIREYDVYWATTHCREGNPERARELVKPYLPEELHPDIDRVKGTIWDVNKTEGFDWESDFIWIDNEIFDEERNQIIEKGSGGQSYIEIDLRENPKDLIRATSLLKRTFWEFPEKSHVCPHCGSIEVTEYIYGLPSPELIEEAGKDENIQLAGCVIESDSPGFYCRSCKKEFGSPN